MRHYGCSSSPIREALYRLTHEGLVVADERRGLRVAPISADAFTEITRLRPIVDIEAPLRPTFRSSEVGERA